MMFKKLAVFLVAASGLLVATVPAHAGGRVSFSFGVIVPPAYYEPPPVYYSPPPVYYNDPPPEYYAPPPVVYAPSPRYYSPPEFYRPAPPVYYGDQSGWHNGWDPGYRWRDHDHDGWRGSNRGQDRDGRDNHDGEHR